MNDSMSDMHGRFGMLFLVSLFASYMNNFIISHS